MPARIRQGLFPEGVRAREFVLMGAFAFFGLCCAYAVYLHATVGVLPYDDAFISYRYVSNLFKGHGPVYNPGERVFGSSTPLYIVWLVVLKTLLPSSEIPSLAVRGNFIFYVVSAFGFLFLFRMFLGWTAASAVAAGLFLLRFDMLAVSLGGNEAFLFCGLVLWSFYFLGKGEYIVSGFLAGFSIMARPEGVFCALLVGLVWLLYDRKRPIIFLFSVTVPSVVWTAFAFAYYGTAIYHSLIAKSRPLYSFPAGFAFRYIIHRMAFWTLGVAGGLYDLGIVAVAALAGFIFRRSAHRTTWFVIPFFTGLILLFYALGNPFVFEWYFPNVFVGWFPLVMVGLAYLALEAAERLGKKYGFGTNTPLVKILYMGMPLLILVIGTFFGWQERDTKALPGYFVKHHGQFRTLTYREAAEFINRVGNSSDTVASPEVGALGFYLRRHVFDSCGLVTPEAIPFLPLPYGKRVGPNIGSITADFARAVKADWIVTMEVFAVESLNDSPWFNKNYTLVSVFPLLFETFGSKHVMVYRRT